MWTKCMRFYVVITGVINMEQNRDLTILWTILISTVILNCYFALLFCILILYSYSILLFCFSLCRMISIVILYCYFALLFRIHILCSYSIFLFGFPLCRMPRSVIRLATSVGHRTNWVLLRQRLSCLSDVCPASFSIDLLYFIEYWVRIRFTLRCSSLGVKSGFFQGT